MQITKCGIVTTLLMFLFSASIFAQGNVRGVVYDKDSGEPIMFANVYLGGTTLGTTTDLDGFYNISNVPAGAYDLVATYIGYDSTAVSIKVGGSVTNQSIYLSENAIELTGIEVSASKEQARSDVRVSAVKITSAQIKSIPGTGGEADLAQYLQVLPGVVFTGDQGGQLYIRGGAPIQNKILLDGLTIYNPFHSIGFFSVFETETIKNVDVLTGGFNAEYGGRMSAIVDITTKDGNKKRFGGLVGISPFQAKAILEGPITKFSEDGMNASFLVTGKHSYIDQSSKVLYQYVDSAGLPYNYTDLYGKISLNSANGSQLDFFGFNYVDNVNYNGIANLNWKSFGGGTSFKIIPTSSQMIIGGHIGYSKYALELAETDGKPRTSDIGGFDMGLNFTYYGEGSELRYGFEVTGFRTDFKFTNASDLNVEQTQNTTELGAFVTWKKTFNDKLIIEPSVRVQYYASLSDMEVEPRFGMKYNATDNFRIKLAAGMYSQNLISAKNEQDVVNLFTGFLSGPDDVLFKPNSTERADHKLQKSIHGIFGVEIDLAKGLELNIEPYYKRFTQLISINPNKQFSTDPNYVTETGDAYGLDILTKFQHKNFFLWAAYSLGYVNRNDGEQIYPTHFDRRHNVNLVTTYGFGPKDRWEASLRWNLGSGFPFTLTQGFYDYFDFTSGISTNYQSGNGDLGLVYSDERNSGRLPYYHRLDLSIKYVHKFGKHLKLEAIAGVTNVYNRENIFYFDRVEYSRVNQLPIMPSISTNISF